MMRIVLWMLAGVLAGVLIHLVVILSLPALASRDVWSRVAELGANNKAVVLPAVAAGAPNPLRLDPELSYAVCQMNLGTGPGVVSGTLPDAFWSLAVYNRAGAVIYSTTNRDGIGQTLDLGIFNDAQTRLLAQQKLDIAEGLLIVQSNSNDVFVVVRLAPPYPAVRQRYEKMLGAIQCGNINGGS
ncbi:MAG: rane protein [Hyphomicrobiales bacterium]|nr:rane protein [Hyphomicrobiales bacterium]